MDRQDSKKCPKVVESKNTYLRIRAPEHLDIALEGLIRKVLKEQPNMDDIYTFAADYFDTLLKIREASGVKKFSTQNHCLSHYDQDDDEMIKLASSFTKHRKESKCISKMYKTLTLIDSDIKKTQKNSLKSIPRNDVKVNNTKNNDFGYLNPKSIDGMSDSKNEGSVNLINETTNLITMKQSDPVQKENVSSNNLGQLPFAELNCIVKKTENVSSDSIQPTDETDKGVSKSKHSQGSPDNSKQSSEQEENEIATTKDEKRFDVFNADNIISAISDEKKLEELNVSDSKKAQELELSEATIEQNGIVVTELMHGNESRTLILLEKELSRIKDLADENDSVKSESRPNSKTNLNLSSVNKDMKSETDTYENKDRTFEKYSNAMEQTLQNQEQETNDESNKLGMEKSTDYTHLLKDENLVENDIKVLKDQKTVDSSDLSLGDTVTESNIKKSLELNQNKDKEENMDAFEAKSLYNEKLLISEPATLLIKCISDVKRFIEHERQFSSTLKECVILTVIPKTVPPSHEKNESEIEIKDEQVPDSLIVNTQINEDKHKEISDFVSVNEKTNPSFEDVRQNIISVAEAVIPKVDDVTEDKNENIEDPDVDSSTTSNEFEFEIYPVKDMDILISEKQYDSDITDEESFTKTITKSTFFETEELCGATNTDHETNDEAGSTTIDSSPLEQMFEPNIVLKPCANKSDTAKIEKGSEPISDKEMKANEKFLAVQETIIEERAMRKAENENMKTHIKLGNIENCQANDVDETSRPISNNIDAINGEEYEKADQVKDIELNNESKPAKTEWITSECQNLGNQLIQKSKNIMQIDGKIEDSTVQVQLTTIIEAEINENIEKTLIDKEITSNIEPVLEIVVDAGLELHKEDNNELETIKLVKAATTIQSGFRKFQRKKMSTKLVKYDKENMTDVPHNDSALSQEKLKSDLPVEASTKKNISKSNYFRTVSKNADMGDKNKNLSRSATKPILDTDSLDSIKKVSLQRTKSLTTIRSGRDDFEVWNQLVLELEEAATKIQSNYRRYKTRKKLRRENAVQITNDSTDSIDSICHTKPPEVNERSTGEFHDSIVLPFYPK